MSFPRQAAAQIILHVVPLVMRSLSMQLRQMEHGLHASHYGVLFALSDHAHNLTDLANEMSVSLPTMSNTISTLEEYGWVDRVRDPDDRRRVLIALSEQGCLQLGDIQQKATALIVDELEALSDLECAQLGTGLSILATCMCGTDHTVAEPCASAT